MAKYDERFKLKVVKEYLSGSGGSKTVGAKHGLGHATVRRWVSSYREHGVSGLRRKGASYDAAFKLQVLNRMWREGWSLTQTAAAFDIRSGSHIGRWERQYHEGGNEALERRRRGCRAMSDQSVKPSGPTAPEQKTLEEVLKENEYLRAENAYLKKLDALIQQKRAAAQKKRS